MGTAVYGRNLSVTHSLFFDRLIKPKLNICVVEVTDYAEEMEILSTGNELEAAIVAIRNKQAQKTAEKLARERELAKVGQPVKQ
jgi:hypothetical protein